MLLYDGECGLCNTFVQKVLRFNIDGAIYFVALNSPLGLATRSHFRRPIASKDTVYFVEHGVCYEKSTAVMRVMQTFGRCFRWAILGWLLPRSIRDFFYDFVADRRHLFFQKKQICQIPTKQQKQRFLS